MADLQARAPPNWGSAASSEDLAGHRCVSTREIESWNKPSEFTQDLLESPLEDEFVDTDAIRAQVCPGPTAAVTFGAAIMLAAAQQGSPCQYKLKRAFVLWGLVVASLLAGAAAERVVRWTRERQAPAHVVGFALANWLEGLTAIVAWRACDCPDLKQWSGRIDRIFDVNILPNLLCVQCLWLQRIVFAQVDRGLWPVTSLFLHRCLRVETIMVLAIVAGVDLQTFHAALTTAVTGSTSFLTVFFTVAWMASAALNALAFAFCIVVAFVFGSPVLWRAALALTGQRPLHPSERVVFHTATFMLVFGGLCLFTSLGLLRSYSVWLADSYEDKAFAGCTTKWRGEEETTWWRGARHWLLPHVLANAAISLSLAWNSTFYQGPWSRTEKEVVAFLSERGLRLFKILEDNANLVVSVCSGLCLLAFLPQPTREGCHWITAFLRHTSITAISLVAGLGAVRLLRRRGKSEHLLSVAGCAGANWLQGLATAPLFTIWGSECYMGLMKEHSTEEVWSLVMLAWITIFMFTLQWTQHLVLERASALWPPKRRDAASKKMKLALKFQTGLSMATCCISGVAKWERNPERKVVLFEWAKACSYAIIPFFVVFGSLAARALAAPLPHLTTAVRHSKGSNRENEARWALRTAQMQLGGLAVSLLMSLATLLVTIQMMDEHQFQNESVKYALKIAMIVLATADIITNTAAAFLLSGAVTSSGTEVQAAERMASDAEAMDAKREQRRKEMADKWRKSRRHHDPRWTNKVEELADRGFTLEALIDFYCGLGNCYMPGYVPGKHTTADVVRAAIIPASQSAGKAFAVLMMEGVKTRPKTMVTHNWGNLFRDLVAAVVADALGECNFGMVAYLLEKNPEAVRERLEENGHMQNTYWICAFSVNQHVSICENKYAELDTVFQRAHPSCQCGQPKYSSTSPPTTEQGLSIECEMNKFDDMMEFLAAVDPDFTQVIAVDGSFVLFSRAWCVGELAMAHRMGMRQRLQIRNSEALRKHEEELKHLEVEKMKASRQEDVDHILAKIDDKAAFNKALYDLIFDEKTGLLTAWRGLDTAEHMKRVGQLAWWQEAGKGRGSIWHHA